MRKALIALLMGATMATPVAAAAPNDEEVRAQRAERQQQRQQVRSERQQVRTERREARQAQQAPRAEVPNESRARIPAQSWPGQQQRAERILRNREAIEQRQERREVRQDWRQDRREDRREERQDARQDRREDRREWRQDNREDRREWRQDRREDRREWRQDQRETRRDWNRDWRQDRRYDWQRYRYANRSLFSLGSYYAPYRHSYSRFSIGYRLGSPFYSSRYWINDPWQYRLPPAYAGTRWVRYYDDVLLVDLYTGEVIDVIYDFFW